MRSSSHALGLQGQFSMSDTTKKRAAAIHLRIERVGENQYRLRNSLPGVNLEKLCPSFVTHRDGIFSRENLETFINFLYQPFRTALDQSEWGRFTGRGNFAVPDYLDITGEDKDALVVQAQETAHRVLRLLTIGSPLIPKTVEAELEKETAECHAETEQGVRDADQWRANPEIFLNGNTSQTFTTVPGLELKVQHGFFLPAPNTEEDSLTPLLRHAASLLDGKELEEEIVLDAAPIERFASFIKGNHAALQIELDRIETEERYRQIKAGFEVAPAPVFGPAAVPDVEKIKDIVMLFQAWIEHPSVEQAWRRYKPSQKNAFALPAIKMQTGLFLKLINDYLNEDVKGLAFRNNVLAEFSPVLAFYAELAGLMDRNDLQDMLTAGFPAIGANTSLSKGQKDLVEVVEKAMKKQGGIPAQVTKAGTASFLEFTGDVIKFFREWPGLAAVVLIGAGGLYAQRIYASENKEGDAVLVRGESGSNEALALDFDTLPKEAQQRQRWHTDWLPIIGLYKHYMYDNAVAGPVLTALEQLEAAMAAHTLHNGGLKANPEPGFFTAAKSVVEPLGSRLFDLNILQNLSHVAFWMYMFMKGYKHGLRGAKRIMELMGPLTDLGQNAPLTIAEKIKLVQDPRFDKQLRDALDELMNEMKEAGIDYPEEMAEATSKHFSMLKGGILAAAVLATTCVSMDVTQTGNAFTNGISEASGYMTGAVSTASTFLVYNFFEDILGVHVLSGLSLIGIGAGVRLAQKRLVEPAWQFAREGKAFMAGLDPEPV